MNRLHTTLAFYLFFNVSLMLSPAQASSQENDKTRYISDVLVINLKDRLEGPYKVVANVQSDDLVRVVEEKDNYFKVETTDGKIGWIAKQYLKTDPPKNHVIMQLKQEVLHLQDQLSLKAGMPPPDDFSERKQSGDAINQELRQKLGAAEKHIAELVEEQKRLLQGAPESSNVSKKLTPTTPTEETSRVEQNPDTNDNALLISEFEKRGKQINDLQMSIAQKNDQTNFLWFGAGAAVFFLGLLAGKINNRKKHKLSY